MKNDDLNEQVTQRRKKLQALRDSGVNPYPNNFRRSNTVSGVFGKHAESTPEELDSDRNEVRLAGRLVSRRIMGKASFAHIRDGSGDIQLYLQRQDLAEGFYESFKKYDLGDILGAVGTVFRTKTGELSIRVHEIYILVKSLHPLPEKFHGLTDIETRYRQRYLDLMVNQESREVFRKRSVIVRTFRDFLDKRGYLEIESPITLPIPGGANARPFVTHHNALDMKLYLRIAQELAIKRCLVGGFDKVYELNRNFRNEGLSTQHNPEFTMLEYNETYLDYLEYMTFTEEMLSYVAQKVAGTLEITYQEDIISFCPPFSRMTLSESVARYNEGVTEADCSNIDALQKIARSLNLPDDRDGVPSIGKLLMAIFEDTVEEKLIQPTFITEYPLEVSPLSRRNDTRPGIADRFELFVAGKELANGFSELNDAEDQSKRFNEQARAKETGDDEAMFYDADYIRALEYGMPPNAGGGIGIDRLVMVLTNQASIRDVLLFPHMRRHKPSDES